MTVDLAMIRRALRLALLAAAAGWASGAAAPAGDPEDAGRIRRAIGYLDARRDAWARYSGADRGQDAEKTTCLSCHTGIGHALARPSLGRFDAGSIPPASADRVVAAVTLRVGHWPELDTPRFRLSYDFDDRKKVESRGTEAVLNALVLARDDAARGRESAGPATRAALGQLWGAQKTGGADAGSWDWLNFGLQPWEADGSAAFGASLAAIAVGSAPGYLRGKLDEDAERGVRSLRDYLRRRFPEETLYNRLWVLQASDCFAGLLSADEKREVIAGLLAVRRDDGGWSLASLGPFERVDGTPQARDSDGYATGLALHALLIAGSPPSRPEVDRALAWLRTHQQDDGSWPARSMNKERDPKTFVGHFMSDAATAIAAQALIEAGSR